MKMMIIFYYTIISLLADSIFNLFHNLIKGRFYTFSSFTIIEFTLFSLFFYLIYESFNFKRYIFFCFALFYVLAVFNLLKQDNYTSNFDSLTAPIESILIIICSILYFYEQLNSPKITFIYASKNFWIVAGIMMYLSAGLFLFVAASQITKDDMKRFWPINYSANIIKNILFAIAFSISTTKKSTNTLTKEYNV